MNKNSKIRPLFFASLLLFVILVVSILINGDSEAKNNGIQGLRTETVRGATIYKVEGFKAILENLKTRWPDLIEVLKTNRFLR